MTNNRKRTISLALSEELIRYLDDKRYESGTGWSRSAYIEFMLRALPLDRYPVRVPLEGAEEYQRIEADMNEP